MRQCNHQAGWLRPFSESLGVYTQLKFNPDKSPDGNVHNLYVITGRLDAGNCAIRQPNFDKAAFNNNLVFRIPTPLFGSGLIQEIPDSTILANKNFNLKTKQALGIIGKANYGNAIGGNENRNGNDGTMTRFGWKAQNKSLQIFAGEAYNVEQGVTNEIFQNKRDETPGCVFNGIPEDHVDYEAQTPTEAMSAVAGFTHFMRFLAPPTPKKLTHSAQHGSDLFSNIGCALCHTPSMQTGLSSSNALSNQQVNLYSDLLVHHMGEGLNDGITQGNAGLDEFRTAPLWGVGQRLFFLHDGRTKSLKKAIHAHSSPHSEANKVIDNFKKLTEQDQSDIIEFLKSL